MHLIVISKYPKTTVTDPLQKKKFIINILIVVKLTTLAITLFISIVCCQQKA